MTATLTPATARKPAVRNTHPGFAVLLVVCSMISLQFGAALATGLFPHVGAAGASTLRLGGAAVILLAATRPALRRWTTDQWTAVVLLGASMAGMNGLFYEALARIPLGAALTVEFLGPLGLAAALSRRPRDLVWVLMALTGVALLGLRSDVGSSLSVAGLAFAVGAGAFWASYIATGARLAATGSGSGGLAASTAIAALIVAPAGLASGLSPLVQPHVLLLGAVVALLASALPYSCEIAALSRLPKRTFSVLLALEPAAGALAGAVLLGQHMGRSGALAVLLVIAAAVGSTLTTTRSEALAKTPAD